MVAHGHRNVLDPSCLEILIAVDHEDRENAADVRPHDLCAAEVVALGMRVLAEDHDLVTET